MMLEFSHAFETSSEEPRHFSWPFGDKATALTLMDNISRR
jgi:hypothetical protein